MRPGAWNCKPPRSRSRPSEVTAISLPRTRRHGEGTSNSCNAALRLRPGSALRSWPPKREPATAGASGPLRREIRARKRGRRYAPCWATCCPWRSGMATLLTQFPNQNLQVVLDPYNYLGAELLPRKDAAVQGSLRGGASQGCQPGRRRSRHPGVRARHLSAAGLPGVLAGRAPGLPLILEHLSADRIRATLQRLRQMLEREPGTDLTGTSS